MDTSDIYMMLTTPNLEKSVAIYIGTHIGSPDMITRKGVLTSNQMYYKIGTFFDHVIFCTRLILKVNENTIYFPSTIQIPFYKKLEILMKLRRQKLMMRLVSVYSGTGAILSLTPFLNLTYSTKLDSYKWDSLPKHLKSKIVSDNTNLKLRAVIKQQPILRPELSTNIENFGYQDIHLGSVESSASDIAVQLLT